MTAQVVHKIENEIQDEHFKNQRKYRELLGYIKDLLKSQSKNLEARIADRERYTKLVASNEKMAKKFSDLLAAFKEHKTSQQAALGGCATSVILNLRERLDAMEAVKVSTPSTA